LWSFVGILRKLRAQHHPYATQEALPQAYQGFYRWHINVLCVVEHNGSHP
jgi:hypothetical protein